MACVGRLYENHSAFRGYRWVFYIGCKSIFIPDLEVMMAFIIGELASRFVKRLSPNKNASWGGLRQSEGELWVMNGKIWEVDTYSAMVAQPTISLVKYERRLDFAAASSITRGGDS